MRRGAELREHVRHLEGAVDSLHGPVDPRLGLLGFSTVRTPNETGVPVSSAASWRPLAASEEMRSKCRVSPRMTHPRAMTQP